jgi:hypothetical protein
MATPLDAERARLRALGLTEDEVSRLLNPKESGGNSQQAAGAAPVQGQPMSGVLGNASAVLSHATGKLTGLKDHLATLFNPTAPAKSRAKSFAVLAFAAAIAVVLGYVLYQEYQINIVNAPITATQQALKSIADATSAGAEATAVTAKVKGYIPPSVAELLPPPTTGSNAFPAATTKHNFDWREGQLHSTTSPAISPPSPGDVVKPNVLSSVRTKWLHCDWAYSDGTKADKIWQIDASASAGGVKEYDDATERLYSDTLDTTITETAIFMPFAQYVLRIDRHDIKLEIRNANTVAARGQCDIIEPRHVKSNKL